METSGLSFIANQPANPMHLFASWHNEAQQHIDPELFTDVITMASISEKNELSQEPILNRNVILRKHDQDGLIFVTERNTKKYKDFLKDSNVAAVFLWVYMINGSVIKRQVWITGTVSELSESEIAEFYKDEPLFAKIRSRICSCGEDVDWNELKTKHDQLLRDYQEGRDKLPQPDTYTAMRITPRSVDFYFSGRPTDIADRVKYTFANRCWTNNHIAT